jgi:predicted flap endonuclease-1-like 5' DNA nuclease
LHNAQAGNETSSAQSEPPAVHDDESRRDELTLIKGIGPALQSRLFAFGYTRFSQLAELDDSGTQRLEQQLELDGHITREDWQGQAAQLSQATS